LLVPRYNHNVLASQAHLRSAHFILALLAAGLGFFGAACTAPKGPGYSIERQEIRVQFDPAPEPHVRIEASYDLRNSGNQPLSSLEVRLPGGRRLKPGNLQMQWDGAAIPVETTPENPRNSLLKLPAEWTRLAHHSLRTSFEIHSSTEESGLQFAPDGFFLPSAIWSPILAPSRGLFGFGGVPPQKWDFVVEVPSEFRVHTSGVVTKTGTRTEKKNRSILLRTTQGPQDLYPFVVAGAYEETRIGGGKQEIFLWTRSTQNSTALRQGNEALLRSTGVYDAVFGAPGKSAHPLWIVECPVAAGCFTSLNKLTATLLGEDSGKHSTAEMISLDTAMVDLSGNVTSLVAAAAPSLAASWLGYGQNPGFFEQDPPLSAFPAFAASLGRNAMEGAEARAGTIRRVLKLIPAEPQQKKNEDEGILRAKSFLFFYGLQDRYGNEIFRKAISHMLSARRGRGFNLNDLIAAFEEETHQNVAEFVRLWMKHPGVPSDFRARYESASTASIDAKEEPLL